LSDDTLNLYYVGRRDQREWGGGAYSLQCYVDKELLVDVSWTRFVQKALFRIFEDIQEFGHFVKGY